VWITADPVSDLAAVAQEAGLDPKLVVIFTGKIENEQPGQVVAKAWDFPGLDRAYGEYLDFTKRMLAVLRRRKHPLPMAELAPILSEDRRLWWKVVRNDPFLPKAILPPSYSGIDAWKSRRELHAALATQMAQPT
jgi:DNA-binding transcriptional regulator PaaX